MMAGNVGMTDLNRNNNNLNQNNIRPNIRPGVVSQADQAAIDQRRRAQLAQPNILLRGQEHSVNQNRQNQIHLKNNPQNNPQNNPIFNNNIINNQQLNSIENLFDSSTNTIQSAPLNHDGRRFPGHTGIKTHGRQNNQQNEQNNQQNEQNNQQNDDEPYDLSLG
jgi:hypothetical protein